MKVVGLDGREYNLRQRSRGSDDTPCSSPHRQVRALLRRLRPLSPVLEEVTVPGSGGLRLDFFLPHDRTAVEVHGEQHFKYTPHFHGTRAGFLDAMRRDRRKAEWCHLNGIRLIVLKDTETEVEWRQQIDGDCND